MEENKTNEAKIDKVSARQMRKKAKAARKAERAEAKAAKKAAKSDNPGVLTKAKTWVGEHKGVVAGAAAGLSLVVGMALGAAEVRKRTGSDEVYDPDIECEPGDDFDIPDEENSTEEVEE